MAVTIALVLTNAQAQQVGDDVGGILGHPGVAATVQEVHDWIWKLAKAQIMNWRRQQAEAAVVAPADIGDVG